MRRVQGKSDKWQVAGGRWQFIAFFCFCFLILSVVLSSGSYVRAQTVTAVDTLSVEIWPDYDQASVLVLLTGTLASDTPLPATITVPLPPEAQINAVARITTDGFMTDDIDFTETATAVTLTTPDPSFRVEYYYPYTVNGDQHEFIFSWTATFTVSQMQVAIQQPASATALSSNPTATSVTTGQSDGLSYHTLPSQAVPAGETYTASVTYQMASPLLTVARLQSQEGGETAVAPTTTPPDTLNWALYLAAIGTALIGIAMFWQAYNKRRKAHRPAQRNQATKANFCHNCGQRRQRGDRFCRQCGTALK